MLLCRYSRDDDRVFAPNLYKDEFVICIIVYIPICGAV